MVANERAIRPPMVWLCGVALMIGRRISRLSVVWKMLVVPTLGLIGLAAVVLVVVNASVERVFLAQLQGQVDTANAVERYMVDQKGPAAIVDGKLTFGSWVANDDFSVVDL